jgi:hypothetical protein
MNILFKLISAFFFATSLSIPIGLFVVIIFGFIVNIFKLNYERDAYWVFSASFIAMILGWIICFGLFMSEISEIRLIPKTSPPAIVEKTRSNLPEPIHYFSTNAKGTVESIHIGGRTEVVPVVQVELTKYFHEENLWVLGGGEINNGIIQPEKRKNYFIPVLSGTLDTRWGSAQLFEASQMESDEGLWNEFRVANIAFKNNEPASIHFRHYNYKNGKWIEFAGYEANFLQMRK